MRAIVLVLLAGLASQAPPPESAGTPAAKASFEAGIAAVRSGDREKAMPLFRAAIEADPRFAAAHEQFIDGHEDVTSDLVELYRRWAAAHPDNAVYEWALAKLAGKDWRTAETHLRRAVAISPSFARAYQDLSVIAELRGENQTRVEYLKKASELSPSDAGSFFQYASAMKAIDQAASIRLLKDVAGRFPGTDRGAQGLYWAAYETTDLPAKLAIYERLRAEFAPETFSWSESGMSDFFDVLVRVDPAKARALAADMQRRIASRSEQQAWGELGAYAGALAESAALRANGDGRAAVQRLDGVKTPRGHLDPAPLTLARAAALEAAGDPTAAYASLTDVTAKTPSDELIAETTRIGGVLKKSPAAVAEDVRAMREAGAKPAPPFTLPAYADRKSVSLADYQGHVVLINFWYPSCGPCRAELPVLQRVLDKYKDRGFVILALNVLPEEADVAVPYLTRNAPGVRSLETTGEWADQAYGVRGIPSNFLLDRDGRIVFRPGVIRSPRDQRTLELQIESLLSDVR